MRTRAEQHRGRAQAAEDLAARTRDPEAKRIYLEMAEHWHRGAELDEPVALGNKPPEIHRQSQQQQQKKT